MKGVNRMYEVSTIDMAGNFQGLFCDPKNEAFVTESYDEALEKFNEECEELRKREEETGGAAAIEGHRGTLEQASHCNLYTCSIDTYLDGDEYSLGILNSSRDYLIYND